MSHRSGYVSLLGRPNVGKSTLLNRIIGQKVAIVSPRPQTTRNRITGIKTMPGCQIIFIDTPGIHRPFHRLGELMVRTAMGTVQDTDITVYMVLPVMPGEREREVIERVVSPARRNILVINKTDTVKKDILLPIIDAYARMAGFDEIIPVSALTGDGVDDLLETLRKYLPEGPPLYPEDMTSDQIERFLVSEIIREKVMLMTRDEIPYSVAVEVLQWDERSADGIIRVEANIYVERESQKGIIVGSRGNMLRRIGTSARKEIEDIFGTRFFLSLWVKVKKKWRENISFLREIGYS